ncbi:MAG: phage tail protein [Methyloprofundus sp.]|nr:phage tail protein [Methyloprofundus sp.]
MWSTPAAASEPFIAEIKMFGSNFAPRGYALCDGQLLPISQNTALFSLLGTTYGGDGRTTFGLPDLRGRVAIHPGNGPGLSSISLGQKGGQEARTLSVNQMPSHTHTMTAVLKGIDVSGDSTMPSSHSLASKSRSNNYSSSAPNVDMHADSLAVSAANTGGNQSFSIRDPYLAVNYIIALTGTFPSRN